MQALLFSVGCLVENYFRCWSRSCSSARFTSIHHLAVSLHREGGRWWPPKPTSLCAFPPSQHPCCATIWLLESPSKLKYLEFTARKFLEACSAYCKKTQGHHIAMVPLCLSAFEYPHSDSSYDRGKCDERVGSLDSTFSTSKIWERALALIEVRVGLLCYPWTEAKENTQMWNWCLLYGVVQHLFVGVGMDGEKKMILGFKSWNWWIWGCATWASPWDLVLGRV